MKILKAGWRTLLGVAAVALGGCASREQTTSSIASAEHPRVVELYFVTMIEPRVHFVADGKVVVREEYPPEAREYRGVLASRTWRRPIPERWEAFWQVVDRLQMSAWKPEYDQGDLPAGPGGEHIYITDGAQWRTLFSTPGHRQESKGDGAFPTAGRPTRTTTDVDSASRNGVVALEEAFEQLLK